jgi:digeranylgeranylglycerophospholipid reductase
LVQGARSYVAKAYDVIVVGAGPAGTAAAKAAAGIGARTLLLEKYPTIMANKPCGEACSRETLETAGVKPEPGLIVKEAKALVYSPSMKCIEINQVGYNINKSLLIQQLAAQAAERGARILVRSEVTAVARRDHEMVVKTPKEEYAAKVVIGADGFHSTVARSLGIRERPEPIPTVQYVMVNCRLKYTDYVRFYLGNKVAPGGYAWIFPRGEKVAEVGVGARGVPAKACLDRFVAMFPEELGGAEIIDFRGAPVPIGGMIRSPVSDGCILVGDAAGTVVPLTGAGIHASIAAGLEAGKVAAEAALEGDTSRARLERFLANYNSHWGERIRRSLKAMRAVEKLSDEELDQLADILEASDVLDLANGFDIMKVARKLLSHPTLAIKLARALL